MGFEYGYIVSTRGEQRRIVLGEVHQNEYEAKKQEIDTANFVSKSQGDENTTWFIEQAR